MIMEKFTKAQRRKLYQQALFRLDTKAGNWDMGICNAIVFAETQVYPDTPTKLVYHGDVDYETFPELYLFHPGDYKLFWWNKPELTPRKICLEFCILMTES